jgi:DNA-binding LacI/PurR family transcriptional regulator
MHVAWRSGLSVPRDLAVVGFDDVEGGHYATPPLTTVAPDKRQIADRALQCLTDRIHNPASDVPALDIVVPHRLEIRGSTRGAATD